MNKKDLVMLIMAKRTLDYQKDPNPENWVTIKGAKVHLDEGGKIDGGAKGKFNGKSYSGTKKSRKTSAGTGAESSKKYESKANEAIEHWFKSTSSPDLEFKNIKNAVKEVRSNMEALVRRAEKHLNQAKRSGNKEEIEAYQNQYDEAKGTLEALNNKYYYAGEDFRKKSDNKPEEKIPEIKTKEDALKRVAELYKEQDKPGFEKNPKANEMLEERAKLVEKFGITYSDVKKAYEGEAKEPKLGAPKSPKKKIDPASTEAQAKRQAIADDVMKRPFVKGKVEEASKKLIAEANKDYGGDHETSVMLENVVKDKDGAYVTLKIVAKDKTGKSRFPQSHSMTFKVGDLTKEQKKLYFSK